MLPVKQGRIKYYLWVFGMTRPGIEPRWPGPLANNLIIRPDIRSWNLSFHFSLIWSDTGIFERETDKFFFVTAICKKELLKHHNNSIIKNLRQIKQRTSYFPYSHLKINCLKAIIIIIFILLLYEFFTPTLAVVFFFFFLQKCEWRQVCSSLQDSSQ